MATSEEWDWPPPRRPRSEQIELKSRIVEERIVLPKGRDRCRQSSKPPHWVERALIVIVKIVFAVPLAGVVLGALWFMSQILTT